MVAAFFGASFGADLVIVPASAASRLNGKPEQPPREKDGGSIRVNGAEIRRFLRSAARLDLGERPAGAVRGARGEELLALLRAIGVWKRDGIVDGGGMLDRGDALAGVKEKEEVEASLKAEGFLGVPSSPLLRLVGDAKTEGSMFSLSQSS